MPPLDVVYAAQILPAIVLPSELGKVIELPVGPHVPERVTDTVCPLFIPVEIVFAQVPVGGEDGGVTPDGQKNIVAEAQFTPVF